MKTKTKLLKRCRHCKNIGLLIGKPNYEGLIVGMLVKPCNNCIHGKKWNEKRLNKKLGNLNDVVNKMLL